MPASETLQIYQLTSNPTLADTDAFPCDNSSHLTYKNTLLQLQNYLTGGVGNANQLTFVDGSTGKINVSSNLTFNASTQTLSIGATTLGVLKIGNLTISSGQISCSSSSNLTLTSATNLSITLTPNGTGVVQIFNGSTAVPINFYNAGASHFTGLKAGAVTSNVTFVLPIADGASGQAITTDGSGNLAFSPIAKISFVNQTTSTVTMVPNTTYFINNGASLVTLTLPATFATNDVFRIVGFSSGGWKIAQNSSQAIQVGSATSTAGTSGFIASTVPSDSLEIIGVVANTTLANYFGAQGNITVN